MSADNEIASEPRHLIHTAYIPARWNDMDALGHVNNAVYLTYFDEARIDWWVKHKNVLTPNMKTGPIIAEAGCKYLKPIKYPANLIIKLYTGAPGRSSYRLYYEIYNGDDNTSLYATGFTVIVWVDYALGKAVGLPEELLSHLKPE